MTEFEQVVQKLDPHAKLLRTWQETGGVSAQVTALEIERPDGQRQKLILRRHGAADLKQNPQVAADEFKLLQLLHAEGLPTPAPYLLAAPYVVMEYIEGKPVLAAPANLPDLLRQMAAQLVRIHQVDPERLDLSFLPKRESLWPAPQRNRPALLHGDFWPGNLLWQDGRLAAVIDWEDAAVGDPLADLANARLEILWAFGRDAMLQFTAQYQAMTTIDFTNLPYWDVWAALRVAAKIGGWGLDAETETAMRERHRWFIAQAFETLRGRERCNH